MVLVSVSILDYVLCTDYLSIENFEWVKGVAYFVFTGIFINRRLLRLLLVVERSIAIGSISKASSTTTFAKGTHQIILRVYFTNLVLKFTLQCWRCISRFLLLISYLYLLLTQS